MVGEIIVYESIKTIKSSGVLDSKDSSIIEKNEKELEKAHSTNQHYRTETEMNASVLAKFPSVEAKYWQCVREETMMLDNLTANSIDFMTKSGELELLQIELSDLGDSGIDKARKKIKEGEIQMKRLQILKVQQEAHYRAVEIKHWEKIKKRLSKNIESKLMEDVELHQRESYKKKWEKEISLGHNAYNNKVNLEALNDIPK